ncbi:MAG: hypothetical protein JWM16_2554 [Verrucomicrobiales bacterium]|nr:hypothetical protein [Verrucomicrobiales bacterium]
MLVLPSLASVFLAGCATQSSPGFFSQTFSTAPRTGEYGADLNLLRECMRGPSNLKESNYFVDLWDNGELRDYARDHGLTNNHALFVISHGGGIHTLLGPRYAYFPELKGAVSKSKALFSARDLAQVLGPNGVAGIHNLVIAGCNFENTFSSAELRLLFPNATNVVHSLPGKNAHETLFRHALIYPSRDVRTLYSQPDNFQAGTFDERWRAKKAQPYIAELFLPGALLPYKIQTAGRELLEHNSRYAINAGGSHTASVVN